jgi:pimeloyl-ACP methyl ester carboxylesterase
MADYRTLDLGDRTIACLDEGSGAPLAFLHAFPLNATMWRSQLQALPPGWRAIAPDLRGFQHSRRDGAPPARHVADHAADVLDLLGALRVGPVVLVGLSMGGYIAFECWRQRPDLIAGLVLADTRAEADSDEARARRVAMRETVQSGGPGAVAEAMLPGLLGASTQTSDPHVAVEVRGMIERTTADGIADALEVLRTRPDSRATLGTITSPTLIVVGAEDGLTPPALSQAMADAIPGATLVTIPRAGHLSNLEHPIAFNDALRSWLDERFPHGITGGTQVE